MKANIFVICVFVYIFGYSGAFAIDHTVEFSFTDFSLINEGEYTMIQHPECDMYGEMGAPQTLVKTLNFIIPVDQTVESIEINDTEVDLLSKDLLLFPVQQDEYYYTCCPEESIAWVDPDPEFYESEDPYPSVIVELTGLGYFDGANHIATVSIYPVFYIGKDQSLFFYSSISFTLNIGGSSESEPIFCEVRMRKDQDVYDQILFNAVENPEDIQQFGYKPALSDSSIFDNIPEHPVYQFLIVTREIFRPYWEPYLEWLNRKGKRAGLLTMETIVEYSLDDNPIIDDDADLLRGYLKYAWERGTVWVILGGSSLKYRYASVYDDYPDYPCYCAIPARYVSPDQNDHDVDCADAPDRHDIVLSEFYYSELSTNWDYNANLIVGEEEGDLDYADFCAELFVGRIPAITGSDIELWIQKLFNYEQNPGNGDYDYLLHAYYTLADQCSDWNEHLNNIPYFPANFSQYFQLELPQGTPGNPEPNPIEPTANQVIDRMSEWPAFVNWHHHGTFNRARVRTGGSTHNRIPLSTLRNPDEWECLPADQYCHMSDLTNVNKPGFVFSIDCENAGFDCGHYWNRDVGGHGLGAEYIFTENGGVGFIGTSRYGRPWGSSLVKNHFLISLFADDPDAHNKIGPAMADMNFNNHDLDYVKNWTLIGSPEQLIWSDIPQHFEVNVDYENDAVYVTSSGNPIENASVCFFSRDPFNWHVIDTDANGYAQAEFDATEETNITVTKHNYIPYQIIGSGELELDLTWRGDIAFYHRFGIPAGRYLIIKPGTTIRIGEGAELNVSGDLIIEGDYSHHVLLTSVSQEPQAGDWEGIRVESGGSLDMTYCDLEYASNGVIANNSSSVRITHSFINDWNLYGIQCTDVSDVRIEACSFQNCGSRAIDVINGNPTITSNSISGSGFGIRYQGNGSPEIQTNALTGNIASQVGITVTRYGVSDTPKPIIKNNNCVQFNYGLQMYYCPDDPAVVVKGNRFNNHRFSGLVLSHDTPILGGSYASEEFNEFSDNEKWGISVGSGGAKIRENAIKRNRYYGIRVYLTANPDVGNIESYGNNTIWGYQYDGYNTAVSTVQAVGNYWNSTGIPVLYGDWNASNPLGTDPYYQAKPEPDIATLPEEFKLHVNYPNPFNPNTIITFDLPKHQNVHIEIFNLLGQKVRILTDAAFESGTHSIVWDGRDAKGNAVGSGIYFYTFISDEYSDSKKMTLIK